MEVEQGGAGLKAGDGGIGLSTIMGSGTGWCGTERCGWGYGVEHDDGEGNRVVRD